MPDENNHRVVSREIGSLRIYLTKGESHAQTGWKGLFPKPLYRQIIDAAKADDLLNAVTHHTHYGFSGGGAVKTNHAELPNTHQNLYIEVIDQRDKLQAFCQRHADLLKGRVIVYKHMEHWDIQST